MTDIEDGTLDRSLSILLVEDSPVAAKLVTRLMEKRGHTVTALTNGQQAVDAVREHQRWDVVLMDLEMPEMDGPTATAAIRLLEANADDDHRTPIIALTAAEEESDLARCRDAGMDGVASKPIDVAQLMRVIANVLRQVNGE